MTERGRDRPLVLRVGHGELLVRRRYELVSIINDLLIAIWFVIGSGFFFSDSLTRAGTWLFLFGSIQLLIRPVIRLARNLHLRRVSAAPEGVLIGSGHDY